MTREQARFLLAARRPTDVKDADPEFAEALQLARTDPELRRWFENETAFDAAVIGRLQRIRPPDSLRDRILVGRRVSRPLHGWRRPWVVLAASLVVLGAAATLGWFPHRSARAVLVREMCEYIDRTWDHRFELNTAQFSRAREWLAAQPSPMRLEVPEGLASSPIYGCHVFEWRGSRATLVCFVPRGADTIVHVISVPREAVPEWTDRRPDVANLDGWSAATWSRGNRIYVALTTADKETLARLLNLTDTSSDGV